MKTVIKLIFLSITLITLPQLSYSLEATFTHAPDQDTGSTDGPLPQSQKQREQLLNLYQQIVSSPNPQDVLQKVAESNGMTADQLGEILMRNVRDMEMASGGKGGVRNIDSIPVRIIRLLSTLFLVVFRSALAHPHSAFVSMIAITSILYVTISAPRNGILISNSNGIFSSGPTTIISPPATYLERYVEGKPFMHAKFSMSPKIQVGSLCRLLEEDVDLSESKNGVQVMSLSKKLKKSFDLVVIAKKKIPFEILLPSEEELELLKDKAKGNTLVRKMTSEELMAKVEDDAWVETLEIAIKAAKTVLDARRFTEFISTPSDQLRFYSSRHDNSKAALVVKKMGDWKRYGIQPLRVAHEYEDDASKNIVYYTIKGGHFDGEIKVSMRKVENDDGDGPSVLINVAIVIPKGGRQIHPKVAKKIAFELAESITTSAITSARQTVSRRLQSTLYRGRATNRASEKRSIAFDNIQKMEEMAAERKRRWARSNPNAGSYRPSGDMHRLQGRPSRSF